MKKAVLLLILMVFPWIGCSQIAVEKVKTSDPKIIDHNNQKAEKMEPKGDYVIETGDTISIFVHNHSELTQKLIVPPSGKISLPFIGNIQAEGETIPQFTAKIKTELAKGYVPNPQIAINIETIAGKKVYVLGEVASPKVIYAKEEIDVMEAITQAGGFNKDANPGTVLLLRRIDSNRTYMDVLNIKRFLEKGDLTQNISVKKGDILYVPPTVIANVDQFFRHLYNILLPVAPNIMQGIIMGPRVRDALEGKSGNVQVE